ncbi:GDSL-type esterase/lipase family protein [Nocardia sp. NPDC051570]|uniref:GDSL-type esterase/lipase family protein n=1 Tax=Nocardia sp. NPDC051570 TaxID=3364324 RepID=UPI0037AB258E
MNDWISTPITAAIVRGALYLEGTTVGVVPHRLPAWAHRQFPDDYLAMVEAQPAGVRVAFRTRSRAIELDVRPTRITWPGATPPAGRYDLCVNGRLVDHAESNGGQVRTLDERGEPGPTGSVRFADLSGEDKDVEIWLPHTEIAELIALRTDAPVTPLPQRMRPVWLHHGSSISHGADADRPTGTWPAVAAALGGVDLVNLSLRGNAVLDPFVARALRDTPADLLSIKIGINLTNTDVMRRRGFVPAMHGFLDTIREGHADTPLLVVSPLLCPMQEHTPGPIAPDFSAGRLSFRALGDPVDTASGRLTLSIIRDELSRLVAQRAVADENLHYLDGRELYGESDAAELPLPDALHPDSAGHRRIGENFARYAADSAKVGGWGGGWSQP